jgi:DNA-directed RNA polymerase II subunit RPB1
MMKEFSELNNKILSNSLIPPSGVELADFVESESCRVLNPGGKYLAAIMLSVKPKENWLMQLVYSGTKGSENNFFNMFAPVGQLKVEGKRLYNSLDVARSSINHKQFSLNPQAMGYIHTSYINGIDSASTHFVGTETRRNVLTKSLGTALGGTIGKVIVRMMESAIVDYRLFTVRGYGKNIIEFNNTGDGFRSCSLVANNYLAATADLAKVYGSRAPIIKAELDQVRLIQSRLSMFNSSYKSPDRFMLPIDIIQLIGEFEPDSKDTKSLESKLKMLDDFCDNIHYCRVNPVQRKKNTKLPEPITCIFTMLRIMLRSNITPDYIAARSKEQLKIIFAYIEYSVIKSFFSPGDPIGIVMGQSETAPLTQFLIDAHHNSASGGTPKDKINYQTDLLSGKTDNFDYRMKVYLKPEFEQSRQNIDKLAACIRSKRLSEIVLSVGILCEQYDKCLTYPDDQLPQDKFIKSMQKDYKEKTLSKIKFRLVLGRKFMTENVITIEDVCNKLEQLYSDSINLAYFIDPLDDSQIILLIFFVEDFPWSKKGSDSWQEIFDFSENMIENLTINEFKGISSMEVLSASRYIDGKLTKYYYIETVGVNLEQVLLITCVDDIRTTCNNPVDTFLSEGLIACKMKVMSELANTFDPSVGLGMSNYSLLSSLVIETGVHSPITEVGQKKREGDDLLLCMAVKNSKKYMTEAAINCSTNQMSSISAHTMLGQTPRHLGTNHSRILVNEDFVRANTSSNIMDMI